MEFFKQRDLFIIPLMLVALLTGIFFALEYNNFYALREKKQAILQKPEASAEVPKITESPKQPEILPPKKLENPPEIIRAVYMTSWSAGSRSYLKYLEKLLNSGEINSVVIDIKDYSGLVSFKNQKSIGDIDSLVRFLHQKNVYVIGRIVVFEDPAFARQRQDLAVYNINTKNLWLDHNSLNWMDPASKEVWDYNIALARDVFLHGFDEVNFDYIRFPTDGNMANVGYPVYDGKIPKREIIKNFFVYLRGELAGERISADLFGQTTVDPGDMGIGQVFEDALENFDYVSPMVYPSHYATGFIGYQNPAERPYEVIKYSLDTAVLRNTARTKIRPWLQAFNMGAFYTPEMINLQIQATKDSLKEKYNGYMLWNPSNSY